MLLRREIFQQVAGFDENLSGTLADLDLCLKVRRAGYLIVYTPLAKLYWDGGACQINDARDEEVMQQRWSEELKRDPYYNPNLSRQRADFSLGK